MKKEDEYVKIMKYFKIMNIICYPKPKTIIPASLYKELMKNNVFDISIYNLYQLCNRDNIDKDDLNVLLRDNNLCIG